MAYIPVTGTRPQAEDLWLEYRPFFEDLYSKSRPSNLSYILYDFYLKEVWLLISILHALKNDSCPSDNGYTLPNQAFERDIKFDFLLVPEH